MYALVVNGSQALARPESPTRGLIPLLSEIEDFLVVMEYYEHNDITVITNFTGSPPIEWSWVGVANLQRQLSSEMAAEIGDAMLCGGG